MGAWIFYRPGCIIVTLPKIDPRAEVHAIISAIFASSARLSRPDVSSSSCAPQNFGPVVGQHAGSRPRRHSSVRGSGSRRCCSRCPGRCRSPPWVFLRQISHRRNEEPNSYVLMQFQTFRVLTFLFLLNFFVMDTASDVGNETLGTLRPRFLLIRGGINCEPDFCLRTFIIRSFQMFCPIFMGLL